MMDAVVLVHRWLGIAFCLLFAMWFASGIVMHLVPFPSLTEAKRFAGLAPVQQAGVTIGPLQAVTASGWDDAVRVRLIQRGDGPVYVVAGSSRLRAIRATDATDATVATPDAALAIAADHAHRRGLDAAKASVELAAYDQWSVPNGFDRHRPLYRVAFDDAAGTDLYVSSVTGEIVLDTTRHQRWWNLAGSVVHWIYPTALRRHWALWDKVVWTVSLLALIAAVLGAVLGIARITWANGRVRSPYRGWHRLHHVIGLLATVFVLSWIFSGWLSMDHGRLFSRGQLTAAEATVADAAPDWRGLASIDWTPIPLAAREVEWFALNEHLYRRERVGLDRQILRETGGASPDGPAAFLSVRNVHDLTERLMSGCGIPVIVGPDDNYPVSSALPAAPVYRVQCGEVWFDVDGASGAVLQRLDPSRRAYRWAYNALHMLDLPVLLNRPLLHDSLIVGLCALGFVFSISGVVIGWRRLRRSLTR